MAKKKKVKQVEDVSSSKSETKKPEKRSIEVNNEHIKAALTQYLWSLRLIEEKESVITWTPSDFQGHTQIHLGKGVSAK